MIRWLKKRALLWAMGHPLSQYAEVHEVKDLEIVVDPTKVWINADGHCVFRGHRLGRVHIRYLGKQQAHA